MGDGTGNGLSTVEPVRNPGGAMVRQQQFSGDMVTAVQETASTAVAAQAKASIEARWIVAMRQPRDMAMVESELLRECTRPRFAEVARYNKPIGNGVEGLSIRFVEAALQILGNCESEASTIYDDTYKRIVEVRVTDYERNVCHRKQITVQKTVERKRLRSNQTAIGVRTNSFGDQIYIVEASDDELLNKEAALVSKAIRTSGLRLIPGWLQEACENQIIATMSDRAARDPDEEQRKTSATFRTLGITPADLADYLGHTLAKASPAQIVELRAVYATIRDGEASWSDIIEHKRAQRAADEETFEEAPKSAAAERGAAALQRKLAQQQAQRQAKASKQSPPQRNPASDMRAEVDTAPARAQTVSVEPERIEVTKEQFEQAQMKVERRKPGAGAADGRPSRSKAARAERQEELKGKTLLNKKAAELYVAYGDPRNLELAIGNEEEQTDAQAVGSQGAEASSDEREPQLFGDSDEGDIDEEPEWMRNPPAGEEF